MSQSETFREVVYKGKTIVIVDLSNLQPKEAIGAVLRSQPLIAMHPPKSVLILTDVTNAAYDTEGSKVLKAWASRNTPYVKASAVVGAEGLRALMLEACRFVTGRPIKACRSREEAMEWLASHD